MAQKVKLYIIGYEKAVSVSFVAAGALVSAIGLLLVVYTLVTDISGNIVTALGHGLVFLIAGLIALGFGIYKYSVYRKKQEETEYLKFSGKKVKGRIVATRLGSNMSHKGNSSTILIADCVAEDPDTSEERHFFSERFICNGSLGGMIVDIYLFPSGQYYVDMDTVRHAAAESGKTVHDFR